MFPPDLLRGDVALVTGASSGLGRRFAEVLAEAGATVVCAARRLERLDEVVDVIRGAGGNAVAMRIDVTDPGSLRRAMASAEETVGQLSILVNNAGISDTREAVSLTDDDVEHMWATNVRAPFALSCELARRLIERGSPGRIVNVASMSAYHYSGGGGALYSMTKAALVRMTQTLAVEWAPHDINVNAIAPGAFHSEMLDGASSARLGDIQRRFPRKRIGEPSQLDTTLLYLVAPGSGFVTGTVVKVDDAQVHR